MNEKKNMFQVGFVTPVVSKDAGGIQVTSYYLSKYLSDKTYLRIFCDAESHSEELECKVFKTKCKSKKTFSFYMGLLIALMRENRKSRFDICISALYPCSLSCYIMKMLFGIPYGILLHGNELLDGGRETGVFYFKRKLKYCFRKILIQNADLLFANSEYTRKLCSSRFKTHRIYTIYPPIEYKNKYEQTSNISYNLFSLGRLEKRKGFQFVIYAMKDLIVIYPELKYYIAGVGNYADELNSLIAKLGLKDHVFMLGRISEQEKENYYQNCDCFIMPSYIVEEEASVEGFGIVYLEANMYGKYVFATRLGGAPDAILEGITGEFVEPEDSKSIVDAINNFYQSKKKFECGKACTNWASKMDVGNIGKQYLDVIEGYLSGNPREI